MLEPGRGRIVGQAPDRAIGADHLRRPARREGGQPHLGKSGRRGGGGMLPDPALQSGKPQPVSRGKLPWREAGLEKPLRPARTLGRFGVGPTR